jgi:hypothetical protein
MPTSSDSGNGPNKRTFAVTHMPDCTNINSRLSTDDFWGNRGELVHIKGLKVLFGKLGLGHLFVFP